VRLLAQSPRRGIAFDGKANGATGVAGVSENAPDVELRQRRRTRGARTRTRAKLTVRGRWNQRVNLIVGRRRARAGIYVVPTEVEVADAAVKHQGPGQVPAGGRERRLRRQCVLLEVQRDATDRFASVDEQFLERRPW